MKTYKDKQGRCHAVKCGCSYKNDTVWKKWAEDAERGVRFVGKGACDVCGYVPWYTTHRRAK